MKAHGDASKCLVFGHNPKTFTYLSEWIKEAGKYSKCKAKIRFLVFRPYKVLIKYQ